MDNKDKKEKISFIDKHNANKKLSIYTSVISFLVGIAWTIVLIVLNIIPSKEEAIAIVILLLGLNSVSIGSDLRGFLKILKGSNDNKKMEGDNDKKS